MLPTAVSQAVGACRDREPRPPRVGPAAWCCCPHCPWELFGAMHLHNRHACALASQHGYKLFWGSRRHRMRPKNSEFPRTLSSHLREHKGSMALHEEGNRDSNHTAAGEAVGWHTMATQWHGRHRGPDLLLLGVNPHGATWPCRGGQSVVKPRGTWACLQRSERAAGLHPASPLRQVWGSAPRWPGTAGYARNAPNALGLDCGRSGRRAAGESLGGLAAARCSPRAGDEAERWQPRSPKPPQTQICAGSTRPPFCWRSKDGRCTKATQGCRGGSMAEQLAAAALAQ